MEASYEQYFYALIGSLEMEAMIGMGKLMSPITNSLERDLARARHAIDMIEMLQVKTTGNLSDEEKRHLDNLLFTLRRNFIDEVKIDEKPQNGAIGDQGEG